MENFYLYNSIQQKMQFIQTLVYETMLVIEFLEVFLNLEQIVRELYGYHIFDLLS